MAKKSSIENNERRRKLVKKHAGRRARLKEIASNKELPMEDRFAAAQRRGIASRLHAGVERIEAPAGGEADRKLIGEEVDGRIVLNGVKWRVRSLDGIGPETGMKKFGAGMGFVGAGPLNAA